MFKYFAVLALAFVACNGDDAVNCNELPYNIFECLVIYPMFNEEAVKTCTPTNSACERVTCLYKEMGVITDGQIDKQKAREFLDKYAEEHPVWADAAAFTKETCLTDKLLPADNKAECPARDFLHCSLTGFAKTVPESQWSNRESCDVSRKYVKACPACPEKCFASQVPEGCDNCMGLLRNAST